jgi:ribonuclease HI
MPPRTPSHRGAGLFGEPRREERIAAYTANIDGASRGNPGPAAYGVVIRDPRGEIAARMKKYIGRVTNNVAEYYALIAALDYAQSRALRALRIESDSELLVNQMHGRYKVKSADLQPLFERAKKMSQAFEFFRIEHVYREKNAEADKLANEALDETGGAKPHPGETRIAHGETRNSSTVAREAAPLIKVRARFRSGVLYPLQDVDLPDGAEVEILLRPAKKS